MTANAYQADAARYLERIAALFGDYKRRALEFTAPAPGEIVLDCGCGAGDDLLLIAKATGGTVSLIGIDPDPETLQRARERAEQAGADIRFEAGSLENLPLADHSVDVARVDRVLQHVPDAPAALRELKRVVKPGGRVVAVDVDWGSLVLDHPDPVTTDRLVAFIRDRHVNGRAGRRLGAWLREVGLEELDGYADVVRVTDWEIAAFIWGLRESLDLMVSAGQIDAAAAETWWTEARAHAETGGFQSAMTGFAVKGSVPLS